MDVRLLGEFRVVRDERSMDPGGSLPRTLLGVLALSVGTVVQRDRLVDAAWGEDPPSSAVATLQSHVSKLRRLLEPDRDARDPSLIVGEAGGYRLELAAAATDVGRFRLAVREARSAAQWQQAVELGAGELLPGCVATWPVLAERRAFGEEWLRAVESWVEAELAEGGSEAVTAQLERLVADHPLRERLWGLLMEALYASGRRSDALDAYQRARRVLVASAGVEPGEELKSVQRRVLSDAGEPAGVAGGPRRGVPASRSPLLGRDQVRTELVGLLEQWRAVTLVGPGGVGKTTLAGAVGRSVRQRFPGGVIFADLTEARDLEEVEAAVATTVGVQFVGEPDDLLAAAAAQLQGEPTLLLVDNCEHVLPAVAAVIDQLLDEVDPLTVLATSRRPLGIGGERVWALEPLDVDAAVALFTERAAGRGGPATSTSDEHVRQLCDQLDRLPLAIEIAAARTDHLTVEEILDDATDRLDGLRWIAPVEGRHRSLDATIRWSYDLLDEPEQAALRRLSVFRGSFDRDQATGVLTDVVASGGVVDVLGTLVGHSLVAADRAEPSTRYRLLDTVRTFAGQELHDEGEVGRAQQRHRDWYLAWGRSLPAGQSVLDLSQSMRLAAHRPDLLAALSHSHAAGDAKALVDLALLASGLAFCPAGLPFASRWLQSAVDLADAVDEATRVDLLVVAAYVAMLRDDFVRSRDLLRQVVPLVEHHPGGVGPFALVLQLVSEPGHEAVEFAAGLLDRHRHAIRSDIAHDIATVLPWARLAIPPDFEEDGRGLLLAVLEQADRVWQDRPWTDRRTFAGWAIHAGLLHLAGDHQRLRQRLAAMERRPERLGPPTYFMAFFEALADAAGGQRDLALDRVRTAWQQHWRGIPGVASELLGVAAIVLVLTGDVDRGRELLDQPGFRGRHPGTGVVHVAYRRRLGLPTEAFTERRLASPPTGDLGRTLDELLQL